MSPPRAPVTLALLTALRTSGHAVGDGAPPRPLPDDELPYAILTPEPGGTRWGPPLVDPDQCASWPYSVRCVGRTRAHVEALRDVLDAKVLGRSGTGAFTTAIVVAGYVVGHRWLEGDGGLDRESDVYNVVLRYGLHVVPA